MSSFVKYFVLLFADFILLCDGLNFLHKQDKYVGSHITDGKHREFAILLLLQVRSMFIKTYGSESQGQEEAGLHDEPVSYLQVTLL